jgi:thiol-disulfide isomerase/thioredoxin
MIFISMFFLLASQSTMAFTGIDGKPATIESFIDKDKWTVVEVWSSDCPVCRKHMPSMVKFDGKLKNTQILGITLDGIDQEDGYDNAEEFVMEYGMKFPNLVTNAIEMNIWMQQNTPEGLIGTPTFMIFAPKGKLVAMQAGPVGVDQIERIITSQSKPAAKVVKK